MPRAAILAYDDCYASSLGGFADILQIANAHWRRQRGDGNAQFEWRFVSPTGKPVMASNGLQLNTEPIRPREKFDLVFIPSAHYASGKAFDRLLARQSAACDWLVSQWNGGPILRRTAPAHSSWPEPASWTNGPRRPHGGWPISSAAGFPASTFTWNPSSPKPIA
ncbi:amidotransferase family protein [Burkholderia cepacia]|nr:amidotransferase family protein [Burkholderia cepacia]